MAMKGPRSSRTIKIVAWSFVVLIFGLLVLVIGGTLWTLKTRQQNRESAEAAAGKFLSAYLRHDDNGAGLSLAANLNKTVTMARYDALEKQNEPLRPPMFRLLEWHFNPEDRPTEVYLYYEVACTKTGPPLMIHLARKSDRWLVKDIAWQSPA